MSDDRHLMREDEKDLHAFAIRRTAGTAVIGLGPRSTR
jgi:hypothetical protein